jgi:PAS domain S-box-containing protein
MLAVRRARLLSARPFGLTLLGALVTVAALTVDEATGAGCGWPTVLLYVAAGTVLVSLPVRLPGGSISLLPAALLPAWLSCGMAVTSTIVVAAVLLASAFVRAGTLTTVLRGAAGLAGVFVGDLVGWIILGFVPPSDLFPEPVVACVAFAIGVWAGELTITRLAVSGGLAGEVRALPGASLIANLLLVFPGTILADVLATRGVTLFALLLVVLIVALGLIALYLTAETAQHGAADERQRLESIVSQVPDGIFAVRPDLTLEWLNDTASRLTGWDPEQAAGQPATEIVQARRSDGTAIDHGEAFLKAARSGKAVHEAATLTGRDGQERSVFISYTSLTDSPDGFEVGVAAVREIAEDSRDAQIADLGHELRSPLTAILGYTGLMLGAAPGSLDAERQAEFISRIAASGDYMLRLVNNLLDLRRMEAGVEQLQPAPIHVDRILQLVVAMARPRASEKQITITLEVQPELKPVLTDELIVRRIVDNLLSNAIKYTLSGGSVRVTAKQRADNVEVAIADTGIGLTVDEQQQLFQRFFRSSRPEARQERGTGLGLALVQESIRRIGGQISVKSEVGQGSTFAVSIPPLAPTDAAPRPAPEPTTRL